MIQDSYESMEWVDALAHKLDNLSLISGLPHMHINATQSKN